MLTVRHGPVPQEFACDDSHRYGGHLQHVAYIAGCELSATPVTSGYRTALVYGLCLQPASAAPLPAAMPTSAADVSRLQALLNSWCVRLTEGAAVVRTTPRRILVLLDSSGSGSSLNADALTCSDRAVYELFRQALQGCPQLGGYFARLAITEHCTGNSITGDYDDSSDHDDDISDHCRGCFGDSPCSCDRRGDHHDHYRREPISRGASIAKPEPRVEDYAWIVSDVVWNLSGAVDLWSGARLDVPAGDSGALRLSEDGTPACTVLVPDGADAFTSDCAIVQFLRKDYNGIVTSTRTSDRTVLVLRLREYNWEEFAVVEGVGTALERLLIEMGVRHDATSARDKRVRLAMSGPSQPDMSLLKMTLLVREPLAIATSLLDIFGQRRTVSFGYDQRRSVHVGYFSESLQVTAALLKVVSAQPRQSRSGELLCRILREYAPDVVGHVPTRSRAITALTAVDDKRGPVNALCMGLRLQAARLELGSPMYTNALELAIHLLEPRVAPDTAATAGQKRRRHDDSHAWRKFAGQCVLHEVARSFVVPVAAKSCGVFELVRSLLAHGRAQEVEFFVRSRLHVIVGHRHSLAALFAPRDPDVVRAIEVALEDGIRTLADMPHGCAMLLALVREVCRISEAPQVPDTGGGIAESSVRVSRLAVPCAALAQSILAEPCEPAMLVLAPSATSPFALCYDVMASPASNDLAERTLERIAQSWPHSREGALLPLLLSRPGLASSFVENRLARLIALSPKTLEWALCLSDTAHLSRLALWEAVARAVPAFLATRGTSDSLLLSTLCPALTRCLRQGTARRELRSQFSNVVCAVIIGGWPGSAASKSCVRDVLRALVQIGDVANATACLGRLSPILLREYVFGDDRFLFPAIESLGWSPFGESLGRTFADVLRFEAKANAFSLAAAVKEAYQLRNFCKQLKGGLNKTTDKLTPAATRVLSPVVEFLQAVACGVRVLGVAAGRGRRVITNPLSEKEIASVAKFISSTTPNPATALPMSVQMPPRAALPARMQAWRHRMSCYPLQQLPLGPSLRRLLLLREQRPCLMLLQQPRRLPISRLLCAAQLCRCGTGSLWSMKLRESCLSRNQLLVCRLLCRGARALQSLPAVLMSLGQA